jgi:hypothetical protein
MACQGFMDARFLFMHGQMPREEFRRYFRLNRLVWRRELRHRANRKAIRGKR